MRFLKILGGFVLAAGAGAYVAPAVCDVARGLVPDAHAPAIAGDGALAAGPLMRASDASSSRQTDPFRLTILSKVAYYVGEDYVDQARVDPTKMLVSALDALQRNIAEVQVEELPDGRLKVHVAQAEKTFEGKVRDLDEMVTRLQDVFAFLKKELPPQNEPEELEYAAIGGMLSTLDPHSVLLPPEVYDEMKLSTSGEFGGLGIVIAIRENALTVISPLDDTPASKAGIKAGDKITRIGEESTVNMNLEEAVKKLRGPKGTAVTIAILRKGIPDAKEYTLIRDTIKIKNVEGQLLSGDIGYIRVKGFQEETGNDVREQMKQLRAKAGDKKQLKGVILDLRNNPGGLLDEAIKLSDLYLENGPIVTTVGVGNKLRDQKDARWPETDKDTPVIVLTNGGSASASEIVAGALKNRDRALVLGEQTFGKGSVQNLFDLRDGSALKLTIAKYLTPGDVSIQSVGVTPDIETVPVKVSADHIDLTGESRKFRESDLDRHFDTDEELAARDKPSLSLRFLEGEYTPPKGKYTTLVPDPDKGTPAPKETPVAPEEEEEIDPEYRKTADLTKDFEVQLAMNLLKSAGSNSRKKMIASANATISKAQAEQDQRLVEEFRKLGIDWTAGKDAAKPKLSATVDFGNAGNATAGDELKLTVTVTNNGSSDVTRLRGISESDEPLFDDLEFAFGRIKPGQSKSWSLPMKLPKMWPASVTEVSVSLEKMEEPAIQTVSSRLTVKPLPHPSFSYAWQIIDTPNPADLKSGNGDGVAQAGEMVEMELTIVNNGPGDSPDPVAIIKNLQGEGIFIDRGRIKFDPLPAGKSGSGRFRFQVREGFTEPTFDLRVTVADAVFADYVSEKVTLPSGPKADSVAAGMGRVELTRGADIRSGASDKSPLIARAAKGGVFEVKGKAGRAGEWTQIALPDGKTGWVSAPIASTRGASADGLELVKMSPPKLNVKPDVLVSRADKASVQGSASDDLGMKDMWIMVNDKKVFYRTFASSGKDPVSFISELPLEDGQNRITVVARDKNDLQSMQTFSIRRDKTEDAARLPKKGGARPN